MINDAKSFLAVVAREGAWGRGETMMEAVKNCRRNAGRSGKKLYTIVAFSCTYDKVEVHADVTLNYVVPEDTDALRFQVEM